LFFSPSGCPPGILEKTDKMERGGGGGGGWGRRSFEEPNGHSKSGVKSPSRYTTNISRVLNRKKYH